MVDTTRHVNEGRQLHVPTGHAAGTTGLSAEPRVAVPFGGAANELDEHSKPVGIAETRVPIERAVAERYYAGAVA
jgi:hypothetical protein